VRGVFWAAIGVCLLIACAMDIFTCEVYNFIWWIAGTAAVLLLLCSGAKVRLIDLGIFCLIQMAVFSKMYGKADCYAFCVCAAAEAALGWGFSEFLFHMTLAFGILAVVQAFRRNINRKGNLKRPVPFLPYITLSFVMFFLISLYFSKVRIII